MTCTSQQMAKWEQTAPILDLSVGTLLFGSRNMCYTRTQENQKKHDGRRKLCDVFAYRKLE